jgi:hypothetical protein
MCDTKSTWYQIIICVTGNHAWLQISMTRNHAWLQIEHDMKSCDQTSSRSWLEIMSDTGCCMTENHTWHQIKHETKSCEISNRAWLEIMHADLKSSIGWVWHFGTQLYDVKSCIVFGEGDVCLLETMFDTKNRTDFWVWLQIIQGGLLWSYTIWNRVNFKSHFPTCDTKSYTNRVKCHIIQNSPAYLCATWNRNQRTF